MTRSINRKGSQFRHRRTSSQTAEREAPCGRNSGACNLRAGRVKEVGRARGGGVREDRPVPRDQARGDVCAMTAMAKAPRSGEVKTRLVPPLQVEEAATLSACFLKDITANFRAASESVRIVSYVAFSPPGSEALFRAL